MNHKSDSMASKENYFLLQAGLLNLLSKFKDFKSFAIKCSNKFQFNSNLLESPEIK